MRIAFTSDIHCDVTPANRTILPYVVEEILNGKPDVFLLAGDVANRMETFSEVLSAFKSLTCRKLLVPGNHDVWVESKRAVRRGDDSWRRHTVLLRDAACAQGFEYLPGGPVVMGRTAFVGSLGWYDFSLRDPRLDQVYSRTDYERGEFLDSRYVTGVWNDTRLAYWLKYPDSTDWRRRSAQLTVDEVFERILSLLKADIAAVAQQAETLVAVIHTNPFVECITRKLEPDPFDAYEGSVELGGALAESSQTRKVYCICGHRHQPLDFVVGNVRVLRSPVGYLADFLGDYHEKAWEAIGTIDI